MRPTFERNHIECFSVVCICVYMCVSVYLAPSRFGQSAAQLIKTAPGHQQRLMPLRAPFFILMSRHTPEDG